MMKHSAKFQANLIKDMTGFVGKTFELARAITLSIMAGKKLKINTGSSSHHKMTMISISLTKDVRGVAGTRSDGRTDGKTDG